MKKGMKCNTCGKGGFTAKGIAIHYSHVHQKDEVVKAWKGKMTKWQAIMYLLKSDKRKDGARMWEAVLAIDKSADSERTKEFIDNLLPKNSRKPIKSGDSTIDNLYNAVADYIEKRGGTVVVIGGIALVNEDAREYNYGVMVRITGKRPNLAPPSSPSSKRKPVRDR